MSNYNLTVSPASVSVSLSRTGGQGAKGDSITNAYIDGSNDFHVVISNAASEVVSDINLGGSNLISTLNGLVDNVSATYDLFDDRFLGAKAVNPSLDNDGNALVTGAIFFNTSTSQLGIWNGASWEFPVQEAEDWAQASENSAIASAASASASANSATEAASSSSGSSGFADAAEASSIAAASSASAAAVSAQTASNQATTATQEAANSLASANNASASASSASTNADEAATSEANAATSEGNASNSAANAAASAILSQNEANDSQASADAAAVSETNAANSAAAANVSQTAASGSAASSATSATNAANSETAAATSAAAALTSEGNAATSESNAATSETNAGTFATNSATSASQSASSAQSALLSLTNVQNIFDSFDDRYLGAKSADPTVDNDGDTLLAGTLYWNTPAGELRFYNGASWEAPDAQAATSAANALASEQAASTSETNAATSETNAATSAAAASTSETNAATSETNAASSASAAASSESSVASNAAAAATSETNAANSEANAATSETNAAASASSAATDAATATAAQASASNSATSASTSETNAATSATNAAASYDQFDDRYLGSKASDPTVDNDGDALLTGAMYFDNTNNVVKVYNGSEWQNASSSIEGIKTDFIYTAIANQTLFAGNDNNSTTLVIDKAGLVSVFMNGIRLIQATDYTVNVGGNSITLSSGAAAGDTIEIQVFGNFTGQSGAEVAITGGAISGLSSLGVTGTTTFGGNTSYGDGVKATFGASADLQVYHDGSNSYITDAGTGDLYLQGANNIILENPSNGHNYFYAYAGGQVVLYHNNSIKLTTTATGIDVTGTVVADGAAIGESTANTTLTVGGSYANGLEIAQNGIDATSSARLFFDSTTDTSAIYNSGGDLTIAKAATVGSSSGNKSITFASNGDISFYEDTGTTAKFFWDASTERLGIGTTSPTDKLHLGTNSGGTQLKIQSGSGVNNCILHTNGTTDSWRTGMNLTLTNGSYEFYDDVNNVSRMIIDNSGNVGIGNTSSGYTFTSGETRLAVGDGSEHAAIQIYSGTGKWGGLEFADDTTNGTGQGFIGYYHPSDYMQFNTAGSEAMRIDSSGNLEMTGGGSVGWANFTFKEESGYLYVYHGSTKVMRVDSSGNAAFAGDVEANATL